MTRQAYAWRLTIFLWAVFGLAAWTTSATARPPQMHAHFINVGQGASTLFEFPCGAVLVDAGAQDEEHADRLKTYLANFFSQRPHLDNTLSAVYVTHPHLDHTLALEKVTEVCRIANYIDNGWITSPDGQPASGGRQVRWIRDQVRNGRLNTQIREVRDAEIVALGHRRGLTDSQIDPVSCPECDPRIVILSGGLDENPGWDDDDFQDLNNHSLTIRIDFGESSFLVTGDMEAPAQFTLSRYYAGTSELDVDVWQVGHHGSANGTTSGLLGRLTPEIAVIGVGRWDFGRNGGRYTTFAYGHPRIDALDLLEARVSGQRSPLDITAFYGVRRPEAYHLTRAIYGTGWDGDVIVHADSTGQKSVSVSNGSGPVLPTGPQPSVAGFARLESAEARSDDESQLAFDSVREIRPRTRAAGPFFGPSLPPSQRDSQVASSAADFTWNKTIPEKRPGANNNGKLVLFDVSHGGTQGGADWVIDGGFSDFADALVADGFTVREYRGIDKNQDGVIRFADHRAEELAEANEAVIEFDAIKQADVLVLAETNRPFRVAEYAALKQFVDSGKGIYFIGDHYNADRNLNSWDSTEVFNGYNRSDLQSFKMSPPYGDYRNPQSANRGWLVENFGLRFRFNAIDCKEGASKVLPPNETEQLTACVAPVLMAASSTLAIVDETKAKGLVYLAPSDPARSWSGAVEQGNGGLYFGGPDEGPVAAISKPSAGKAAFLGDSSPIEDDSPKYVREDNGKRKSTHPGWKSRGNAATLSLNIVRWLATPENYVGFTDANGHRRGFKTPVPMAAMEKNDPDNGSPWATPSGGYDPWNPATFRSGSFGAPRGPGQTPGPGGPHHPGTDNPHSSPSLKVSQALAKPRGVMVRVKGVIQGPFNSNFGLRLADSPNASAFLAVQIPGNLRDRFNPLLNPSALGQQVEIVGTRDDYMEERGLKSVQSIVPAPSP